MLIACISEYEIFYVDGWRIYIHIELGRTACKLKITKYFDWMELVSCN